MENHQEVVCCPPFIPETWQDKTIEWNQKKFIRRKVRTFFYMPINFGSVVRKLDADLRKNGVELTDNVCLSDHTSMWNMDIYVAVDKDIPGSDNTVLDGKFYSRVYEGPFRDTGKWCKDFDEKAKAGNINTGKLYMWYTTCPKCAKKYGKNYVALIAAMS